MIQQVAFTSFMILQIYGDLQKIYKSKNISVCEGLQTIIIAVDYNTKMDQP
jgi:hypothetical protein